MIRMILANLFSSSDPEKPENYSEEIIEDVTENLRTARYIANNALDREPSDHLLMDLMKHLHQHRVAKKQVENMVAASREEPPEEPDAPPVFDEDMN